MHRAKGKRAKANGAASRGPDLVIGGLMMFNFFRRAPVSKRAANPTVKPAAARRAAPRHETQGPVPLPEVVEGNEPTDWALWEDSVSVLDSQMQFLTPSARIYDKPAPSSQHQDIDVFSSVSRKDP